MESLSRPPHRRKHSTANIFSSSFSFKNPYDDVLRSNGGERKSLEAHEYSEIFSGSSSIPVLDLSGLDERVGSGDSRNSKLDYSGIFGGFGNDDVFMPYEELLNGSAKKTKPRIPADAQPCLQESGSLHSSRKKKRSSGEASDQSVEGVKQQFNMSFNRTNQINSDASDVKTHIARLHAVPGFTHFVDETPWLDKTKDGKLPSLKREVSRTWSFSAEVRPVNDKHGSCGETSQIRDKSHNVNEPNLESQFPKVSPASSCPTNLSGYKDPRQSRASNFASKENASQKSAGECSPPFFGEEYDENSVDAISAAALKKAIEQAQESIRIAKMIMERKKEVYQDASKTRPIGSLKVSDREAKIDREAYVSKDNNAKGKHEELDHIFNVIAGIDGKFPTSLSHSETIVNAANSEVERVWDNVEVDKEYGESLAGKSKLLASNFSQSTRLHNDENVKLEKLEKNVEAANTQRQAKYFPGLVANDVCGTVDLEPGKVGKINSSMSSMCKIASNLGEMETGKEHFEWRKVPIHHTQGSEVVAKPVEMALNTSQRTQGFKKSVDDDEFSQATSDHAKGTANMVERAPVTSQRTQGMEKCVEEDQFCQVTSGHAEGSENMIERVLGTSQRTPEHYKVVDEAGENLSISQEGGVNNQKQNDMNDKEKCGRKLEEHEEMLHVENLVLRSEFNNVVNESCNPVGNESLEQEEMEKRSENVSEWKENGQHGKSYDEQISGTRQGDAHLWFESKEQLKEALLEEINKRESDITPEIGELEKKVDEGREPEIDDKEQDRADDGDEPNLAEELMQNKVEEEHVNTCQYEATGTIMMEANHCAEVQKKGAFWDAEETENALGGVGSSEGEVQEAAYEEDIDEAVELSSSDARTISNTREACNVDLKNEAEEHQKTVKNYKENDTMPQVNETVSAIGKDRKAEQLFHQEDNEILGTNSLHRSASEEIFVENNLHDAFEGLYSDGKMETVGVMDADPDENLPKDEDVSNTTSDIHDAAQEYAAEINRLNLPEDLVSDIRTAEFDFTDVRQVLEQTSENDGGSVSASSSEKIDGLSAHESEECAENAKDETSDKEDLNEMISDERKCAEELSEALYSQLHGEPKEMDETKETERAVEGDLNMENTKENLAGTSPTEERDAKESVQHTENDDQQQRIEAIKRGREREKDRIAVERAIREARERAFAEARERAERAAVERAAAEARQRVMAEAREKVEKASTEAKLRAERAAVERATSEARERALEKAMSQKISTEARTPADRHPTERVSSSSRNSVLKHSFSSSDLETGMNTESAQRRKARLERHQRIMERAAKALAEKNMRDLLAQKEQAERNRLAESLDADIKRWATGKEGNLRALLSTLQYILGPDSGWQPISLTEIITTAAVKKAYRKATLYVHPDKLQQRGASVQQKYICEKVFDLLKAAWNRFNSDER